MPFQSEKQKKWMWANKPEMAREWTQEYGSKVKAKTGTMAKDKNWIQKATKNMRKDKPCTGDKFGGPTCPKGSRRYNLAKTFKKMAKKAGGGPIKAQDSKFIQKKKWWANPKKLKDLTTKLKADLQFINEAHEGKLSPSLMEKAKTKVLKKSSADQGSGYADEIRKIIKQKPSIVGDEAKGGQGFTPGWKPHLSVKTAKKGSLLTTDLKGYDVKKVSSKTSKKLFELFKHRDKGGWKEATGYKKHLKALKAITTGKSKAETTAFMKKATKAVGAFPLGKAKASTAMGKADASKFLKRRMVLGMGSPAKASKLSTLSRIPRVGKIALATVAALEGTKYVAKKMGFTPEKALAWAKKKKVQKKSTGGEIIIGRGVDLDLL